jgi:hypothetical protein
MKPKLIAFFGPKGCGKSTAAKYLTDRRSFVGHKFAATLKNMLYELGIGREHIEGQLKETPCDLLCGKTPRHAMQTLGTQWGRELIGDNFWVGIWSKDVQTLFKRHHDVVTDDLRFPNEADAVRKLGGTIVRLYGRNDAHGDKHESEGHYDKLQFDYVIHNRGTIMDLHSAIEELLHDLDSGDAAQFGR